MPEVSRWYGEGHVNKDAGKRKTRLPRLEGVDFGVDKWYSAEEEIQNAEEGGPSCGITKRKRRRKRRRISKQYI